MLTFDIFALSKLNLLPNPEKDEINAIFFRVTNEKAKAAKSQTKYKNSKIKTIFVIFFFYLL